MLRICDKMKNMGLIARMQDKYWMDDWDKTEIYPESQMILLFETAGLMAMMPNNLLNVTCLKLT